MLVAILVVLLGSHLFLHQKMVCFMFSYEFTSCIFIVYLACIFQFNFCKASQTFILSNHQACQTDWKPRCWRVLTRLTAPWRKLSCTDILSNQPASAWIRSRRFSPLGTSLVRSGSWESLGLISPFNLNREGMNHHPQV